MISWVNQNEPSTVDDFDIQNIRLLFVIFIGGDFLIHTGENMCSNDIFLKDLLFSPHKIGGNVFLLTG